MNQYEVFNEEYVSNSQTKSDIKDDEISKPSELEIGSKHYTTSKPKRITIRAKLIHDKS